MEAGYRNYLGIDMGKAKVGIALAHEETRVALPYGILPHTGELLENIGELLQKEEIGTVVIGIPTHEKHTGEYEGEVFGRLLEERFGVQVVYEDEMFTTKMAQESLKQAGGKAVGQRDDAEAAKIILASYIDKMNKK
jgi:putative transcription antitermination factor YqgF